MKYLFDSLSSVEADHADALNPMGIDCSQTYLGEGELLKPATVGHIHFLAETVMSAARNPSNPAATHSIALEGRSMGHMCLQPRSTPCTAMHPDQAMIAQEDQGRGAQQPLPSVSMAPLPKASGSKPAPIPGVRIPNLARSGNGNLWRKAIQQWEEGDSAQGLLPLRDWPEEWYTSKMRLVYGTKRRLRQVVAEEYTR